MKLKKIEVGPQGYDVVLSGEKLSKAEAGKVYHDIQAALRTMQACTTSLEKGYRFDDASATAKVEVMRKANDCLQQHAAVLAAAYKALIENLD